MGFWGNKRDVRQFVIMFVDTGMSDPLFSSQHKTLLEMEFMRVTLAFPPGMKSP